LTKAVLLKKGRIPRASSANTAETLAWMVKFTLYQLPPILNAGLRLLPPLQKNTRTKTRHTQKLFYGIRWAIEQCFEEGKTELGMDHYEVRKYPGWNHHMLTIMLAHFFLWHLKIRLGGKSSICYTVAA